MTRITPSALRRNPTTTCLCGLAIAALVGATGCARPSAGSWAQLGPVLRPLPGGTTLRPLTSRSAPDEGLAGATALHRAPEESSTASR